MSLISFSPLQDGVTGVNATATNTPLSTIYNDYNGNITDANIAANAAIAGSKINITTFSNPYKFTAYRTAAWNTGTGGQFNVVPLDTTLFDTGSNFNTTTNRFIAPVAGFYFFAGTATTSTTNVWLIAGLFKNGTIIKQGQGNLNSAGAINSANVVSGLIQLAATDYVQLVLYSNTSTQGGAIGAANTYLDGFLVSAT